jgi:hypothetical protein
VAVHGWSVSIASVYHGGSETPILVFGARLRSAAALNATDRRDFAGAIAGRGRCGCLIQDLGINRLQRRGDDAAGETVDAVLDVGQAHVAGGAASEFAVSGQQGGVQKLSVYSLPSLMNTMVLPCPVWGVDLSPAAHRAQQSAR